MSIVTKESNPELYNALFEEETNGVKIMTEEIKGNNIPINVLQALGDLTNGAINYYTLPKTTLEEQKIILNYITDLQKENELHGKILKDANDVLNIQAQKGNYNYDSYMLGLYNGMEMIVSLFEQREPKLKSGKDIKFLHETDYKSRNEKAVEKITVKQARLINEKDYVITDLDLDEIMQTLESGE